MEGSGSTMVPVAEEATTSTRTNIPETENTKDHDSLQWNEQLPTLVNVVPEENETPSESGFQSAGEVLRCLICYNVINIEKTLKPFSGKEIYQIFSLKTKHCEVFDNPNSNPPCCSMCIQLLSHAQEFMAKLDELEKLLEQIRQQLKSKVLYSFEQHDVRIGSKEAAAALENKTMVNVEIIRQDVLISIKRQLGITKRPGRPKRGDGQSQMKSGGEKISKSTISFPDPFVLLEELPEPTEPTRSKAGRVIKRPQRLMMVPIPFKSNTPPAATINETLQGNDNDEGENDQKKEIESRTDEEEEDEEEDEKDFPDPEWSPGVGLDEENEEADIDDDGEEDDEDFTLQISDVDAMNRQSPSKLRKIQSKSKSSKILKSRPSSRLKRKRSFKPSPKSNRKLKKSKPSPIPIQVITPKGEKLDAYYVPEEKAVAEGEIEEGSILPMLDSNSLPGVRILCSEKCPKTFYNLNNMQLHVRTAHLGETNPFTCETCSRSFESRRNLKVHAKIHGELPASLQKRRKLYSCSFEGCDTDQKYRSVNDLDIHIRSNHTHEKPFKCDNCPETFVSDPKREYHIENNHPDVPPYKCTHCPKSFFREHRHREHLKTHTGDRPFMCEICSKCFSQQSYLKYHQTSTHKELELEPYKCQRCDKTFATPANLTQHVRTQHENQYRYRCQVCHHGADHLSHLRLHMLTHSGERPHICDCGKSFSRASQLKIHMRNHTGERPYVCELCEKSFTNSSKLRRHKLTHSEVKPHICQYCQKGFTQISNLNSHIHSTHKKGQISSPNKNDDKEEFTMEVVEHVEQVDHADPETQTLELQPQTVFQSQVFGIQSQNFANMPIQFQVLTDDGTQGDGGTSYAEFIIVNQI